jgi:hypothetical protein
LALIGLKKNNVHANSQAAGIQAMGAPKLRLEKPNYLCNNPKLQVCALPQLLECVWLRSVIFILHHETVHSSYRLLYIFVQWSVLPYFKIRFATTSFSHHSQGSLYMDAVPKETLCQYGNVFLP